MVSVLLLPLVHSESAAAQTKGGAVFVIPVDQEIEQGLGKFMERGFAEAADFKAGLILLDINTPGGRVDTAEKLGKLIKDSPIPTVAYIRGEAASAGSYIALSANKIVMKPGSIIGAAALVDGRGQAITDPKTIAWWKSSMASAAEAGGRNPDIARGMVDSKTTISIPEMNFNKENGQIISLTSEEALELGYADHIASSEQEVIQWMGYSTDDVIHVERTWAEKAAEILTNPIVQTLLLFIGIAGVVIELLVPGFGVPGILGILGFGLYFSAIISLVLQVRRRGCCLLSVWLCLSLKCSSQALVFWAFWVQSVLSPELFAQHTTCSTRLYLWALPLQLRLPWWRSSRLYSRTEGYGTVLYLKKV